MLTILNNELFFIEHDAARKLVYMRRKNQKISTVNWDDMMESVLSAVQFMRGQRLLLDARLAPGNNDPSVEHKVQLFRRQLTIMFPISATLVATAVGRLQVMRLCRERGEPDNHVFLAEADATAYLMAKDIAAPQR